MSVKRMAVFLFCTLFLAAGQTWANTLELEDINFPYNSKIVVDDLKQIPHLADMLKSNSDLFLEISAHADWIGSNKFNQELSFGRANSVKEIIVDHGISPDRISIMSYGEESPKMENKTVEGRFVNRRAVFSIYMMKDGKKDYYYKDNELIKPFPVEASKEPSDDLMDKDELSKRLDDLEALLRDKSEVPPAVPPVQAFEDARGSIAAGIGVDKEAFTSNLEGKLFIPFYRIFAIQAGLTGDVGDDLKEYQVDGGLVVKFQKFQLGIFSAQKSANIHGFDETGKVSEFSIMASKLFDQGSFQVFYTEGINSKDSILIEDGFEDDTPTRTETALEIADKLGIGFDYVFNNGLAVDADIAAIQADDNEHAAGNVKLSYLLPAMGDKLRVFLKGSVNNGLVSNDRELAVYGGIEFGNWYQKKPAIDDIRPMLVPNVSYELVADTSSDL